MHLAIDGWRIDIAARSATRGALEEQLSPRAIRLLQALAATNGAVVSRGDLLDQVWPNVFVSDESLTQVVSEVRRKLGNRDLIATVARGGYRLTVPVLSSDITWSHPGEASSPLLSLDAYMLCLEARQSLERGGEDDLQSFFDLAADAATIAPESAETHALHAEALFKRHIYWSDGAMLLEDALTEAEAAIRIDPRGAKAHLIDASARIAAGWVEPGLVALERALTYGRDDADVHLDAAKLLYTMGNSRAASVIAIKAASLAPDEFEADFLVARILMVADPYRSRLHAERALRKVRLELSDNPHAMRPLYTLGPLLAMLGETRAAQSAVDGISHHDSPLEYHRALALAEIGDVSSAMERLKFLGMRGWRHGCILDKEPSLSPVVEDPGFARLDDELAAV
ncbi:MAG: winged helix-turn-helix domain-containing protein [Pseudomonadota bacterium]